MLLDQHQRNGANIHGCHETRLYNQILESLGVYESKIPEELRDEIYKAEANTEAAQNRGKRIALYTVLAILGIALASFNGFLTEIRASASPEHGNNLYVLEENGFGWVLANPVFKFFFTNKIGGGLCFLFGGGSGLLAEAELDTKRINAEKIYEELERRRNLKAKIKPVGSGSKNNKKKRRSGKETKRLGALSEVVMDDDTNNKATAAPETSTEDKASDKQGVFSKVKEFYEMADSMAASQALIMNKNLEDAGMLDKITDESGLKVIGREEAKKLEEKDLKDEKPDLL